MAFLTTFLSSVGTIVSSSSPHPVSWRLRLYFPIKRLVDLVGATAGLALLLPLFAAIGGVVRASLGKPVLFQQERAGRGELPFTLYKFRTMTDARDQNGVILPDTERLTSAGRWLRALSLDELPELWNVLRGDMSLVGPRPLPVRYLPRYLPEERRRHDVRPGITGWAQVSGRNAIAWPERLALDVWYVDRCSLWLDFRILWLTTLTVLRRQGVTPTDSEIMDELRHGDN